MKKLLIVVGIIVLLLIAGAGAMYYKISTTPIPVVEVGAIDLNRVADGSYSGEFDANIVKARVKVDVAGHKITNIKIEEHKCGTGQKAEVITKDVIGAQSLKVDTISGATLSSKVILKSVENALTKGIK